MAFNFTAFSGGFAEAAVEDIQKAEKLAAIRGAAGVKQLAENYKSVVEDNSKAKKQLKENINFLRTYDPTATEQELFEIAKSKSFMGMVTERVKKDDFDASSFKISNLAQVSKDNNPATALERADEIFRMPAAAKAAFEEVKPSGSFFRDMTAKAGARSGEAAARETAAIMGISLEQLQSTKGYALPELQSEAVFNMGAMKKEKTFEQQENDAKSALLKAERSGDTQAANLANADLIVIKSIKDKMSPAQTTFANKVADIKNRYMLGTPEERKAAKPEYDQLMKDIVNEAAAKKAGEGKDEKIPAMSTLNTFTSGAVARAVAAKHGDLIKSKQLAIVEKPDGSVGIDYIGDNDTLRRQILETQAVAARNALSLYTDAKGQPFNRDIASILNSYTSVVPSVVRTDGAAAPAAAGPQPAAKPTVPTPTSNLRKEAEAAIAKGADRAAVAKSYKEKTGQEF